MNVTLTVDVNGDSKEEIVKNINRLSEFLLSSKIRYKSFLFNPDDLLLISEIRTYHLQIDLGKGSKIKNLTTSATSYRTAIEKIMQAEGCSESDILKIWT